MDGDAALLHAHSRDANSLEVKLVIVNALLTPIPDIRSTINKDEARVTGI